MKSRSDFRMNGMDFRREIEITTKKQRGNKRKIIIATLKYFIYLMIAILIVIAAGFLENFLNKWIHSNFFSQ